MLDILLQADLLGKLIKIPVDPNTDVSAAPRLIQDLDMFALPAPDNRSQKLDLGPLRQCQDLIHHLVYRLFPDLLPALGAVGNSHTRIQKTHVIIDFRHSSHGRSGIPVRGLLINGNRRRQPLDAFHIRLLHLPQELSGVGGKRLHVSALSFCVDCIKGQGRFAGAGEPGKHHKFISGNVHREIFQIVFIRTANFYILFRHFLRTSLF